MKKNKIYKWSLFYEILRWFVRIAHRLFYSSVVVIGKENIPEGVPVIFAPNHQNALMDPLAIVCTLPDQVVFLARADIFSNKIARSFLRFLKILPVYRIRDGKENLDNNQYIFDLSVEVLKNNKKLCLMPEGMHNNKHQLRPLVKGIFRIAFKAFKINPSTVIIPVGLDYSSYTAYRSRLIIQYGKPIKLADYKEIYSTNQAKATYMLRNRLTNEIKDLMINIENSENYDTIENCRETFRPIALEKINKTSNQALNIFLADKWFTEKCNEILAQKPSDIDKLSTLNESVRLEMKKYNLKPDSLCINSPNLAGFLLKILSSVVFFPLFLFGLVINEPMFYIPYLINRKIDDKQFHSTIKFSATFFAFPFYYLLLFVLIILITQSLTISIVFVTIALFCGICSIYYFFLLEKLITHYKSLIYKNRIKLLLNDLKSFNFE